MTLEAGSHIGKYVVRRKLAEGGMAEIYLCTARGPEGFEKEVVIKRVRAFLASDQDFVQMFIAEARLASRLNHANVVQIFDFDKHEDTYYLAMEYVRGCSLWELRRRCKELLAPMPPTLVAHIGTEVARGLHYAHRLKVNGELLHLVHRDVTPHNVLLSFDGAVKLTDFGIAKAGNKLTQPGVLKGKFAYMSPEQARGEPVDARTDVFALGVVLWEMLTGGRLFEGDSEVAVLRAVQQSAIPPPVRLNPDVPADLDAVVTRALERDAQARFQTAGELERALAECVLKHATSVDDTDVGAFLRRLFPSAATMMGLPAVQERTQIVDVPVPPGASAPPAPREPTAVMARGGASAERGSSGVASGVAPDEDIHAPTFVLPRREEAGAAVPPPPAATPMMPLPAVGFTVKPAPRAPTPAPLPPVASSIAAVRPSQPEGVSSVSPSEAWPDSTPAPGGNGSARKPSRPEGVSSVSSPGVAAPAGPAEGSVSARRPSRPEVSVAGASPVDAARSAPSLVAPAEGEGAPPELPTRNGTGAVPPKARRGALWTGVAVLGAVGVVIGAVAVVRSGSESTTPPGAVSASPVAPAETPPARAADPSSDGKAAPPAPAPVADSRAGAPDDARTVAAAPAGAGVARGTSETESEVDGLEREAALTPEPKAPSGEARTPSPEAPPAATATESTGTLKVRATPYATVFLDGKRLGDVQGQASYKVASGTYKVTFQHPTGAKSFTVTVPANGSVSQDFRASKGR